MLLKQATARAPERHAAVATATALDIVLLPNFLALYEGQTVTVLANDTYYGARCWLGMRKSYMKPQPPITFRPQ
jgi:hypothetical protein